MSYHLIQSVLDIGRLNAVDQQQNSQMFVEQCLGPMTTPIIKLRLTSQRAEPNDSSRLHRADLKAGTHCTVASVVS